MVNDKIIEFEANIAKMGNRKIIDIPTCISHGLEKYRGKKVIVVLSTAD